MFRILFVMPFFSLSAQAAEVSYKFRLQPNSQVLENCQDEGTSKVSKLKIIRQDGVPTIISARLCTNGFGFRRADLALRFPAALFDEKKLLAMKAGASEGSAGITWTRQNDAGTVAWYRVSFDKSPVSNMLTLGPVQFAVESDETKAAALKRVTKGRFMWSAMSLSFKHKLVADSFVLKGRLDGMDIQ